jgi:hypothetical protein
MVARLVEVFVMIKVAYFSSSTEDYLADSVLHGLRELLGANVVDFPKAERLYNNCPESIKKHIRGGGFSLYGLLDDINVDRHYLRTRILDNEFDLVVFGDIYNDFGAFIQLSPMLDPNRAVVLDGSDTESIYPYSGNWWRHPAYWFLPRANRFLYFKRELTPRTLHYRSYLLVPEKLCRMMAPSGNIRPIAFSIPVEKIVKETPVKRKLFATHVVDAEVAEHLEGTSTVGVFATEAEYYNDLQASRFAITTKRGGWDCLRHYEIAANGCVMCFRNLDQKPATCAPHGLSKDNCVVYHDYDDLQRQIGNISDARYEQLQAATLKWASENTTIERAKQLLRTIDARLCNE